MPSDYYGGGADLKRRAMDLAKRQVRAKFPNLAENTSGWNRAVENRYRRNYG